jgi:hypothetical protein
VDGVQPEVSASAGGAPRGEEGPRERHDAAGKAWTQANAEDLPEKLVCELVFDFTHGGTAGKVIAIRSTIRHWTTKTAA